MVGWKFGGNLFHVGMAREILDLPLIHQRYWLYCLHNLSFEGAHNLLCLDLSIVWRMAVVVVAGKQLVFSDYSPFATDSSPSIATSY